MTGGPEHEVVEKPLIDQLIAQGWDHVDEPGDLKVTQPELTERERFKDVILQGRLEAAIRRINVDDTGECWLDDEQVRQAISALRRLPGNTLIEKNKEATHRLLSGTRVQGPDGRLETVHFIDFDNSTANDFLVIDQFRVDGPGAHGDRGYVVPDVVLFVNGVPVVVVECKSPSTVEKEGRGPIAQGIKQLRRYANQLDRSEQAEGAEKLFHTNQFTVSTSFDHAYVGTFTARPKHYMGWKDTYPLEPKELADKLGVAQLSQQHKLTAALLEPAHLLDVIRNFTLFHEVGGREIKIVCRYQQWRGVQKAIEQLRTGKSRQETPGGEPDKRGGIIWHTQGSGKSLTMMFLIRKIRTLQDLRRFKIVLVTDRTDLQEQLAETAQVTDDPIQKADSIDDLKALLARDQPGVVFGMIQKFQEINPDADEDDEAEVPEFDVLNESEDILVLVDEAHRSHTRGLHANLMTALPNCAKIGFTGTPILKEDKKRTTQIFGPYIDTYTIEQSQQDGTTVKILYEGRPAVVDVQDKEDLDAIFDLEFGDLSSDEREQIRQKYARKTDLFEAKELIQAKAHDMLRHYVANALPNGLKAQVVGVSRKAAIRYQDALEEANHDLIAELQDRSDELENLHELAQQEATADIIEQQDEATAQLARAYPHLDTIEKLEFATVVSGDHNDPPEWKKWTRKGNQASHIKRFKRDLEEDPLCMLCVKSMLLTGFDAPVNGVLYLDRLAREHELLQAIARVNRPYPNKQAGLVVDYYGVAQHLREALELYTAEDLKGAWQSIKDELKHLELRHQAILDFFSQNGVEDIYDTETTLSVLKDDRLRAKFKAKLKPFLTTLDTILPRREGLKYVPDAKQLGYLRTRAERRYRDEQLTIADAGEKVQAIIDEYVKAHGINPRVPPVDILETEFEEWVEQEGGSEAQAAAMEHAVRHHIHTHWERDPVRYEKLSERLEALVEELEGNWEDLVEALRPLLQEIREGAENPWPVPDPEVYAPFMSMIMDRIGEDNYTEDDLDTYADHTITIVDQLRAETCKLDFWRNQQAQDAVRGRIFQYLDKHDIVPFERADGLADELLQLAKARHEVLCG